MLELMIGDIESNEEAEERGLGMWKFILTMNGNVLTFYAGAVPCDPESTTEYRDVAANLGVPVDLIVGGGLMMYEGGALQICDGSEEFGPVPSGVMEDFKDQLTAAMGLRYVVNEVVIAMDNTSDLIPANPIKVKFWEDLGYSFERIGLE
jgi:hypothetical protein